MEGTKRQVFSGTAHHTPGGLTANKLKQTKDGRIVSAAKSAAAKKNPHLRMWRAAVAEAKKNLGLEGFHPVKGELHELALKFYRHQL